MRPGWKRYRDVSEVGREADLSSASRRVAGASETDVRVGQVLMTCDLERELGIGVAVDVALDNGEITIRASFKRHSELPGRGGCTGDQREALIARRACIGVYTCQIDPIAGFEGDNGVSVGGRGRRELEGVVTGTAVYHVDCVARGDGVVAGAGI